jgi:hypothetical protein
MNNEQYNKNSTLNESYTPDNNSGQMMFKNGFMDDFCSDTTEDNINKPVSENNLPQGIIVARMPDLGDCKPIPNGISVKQHYCADNDNKSTTQTGLFRSIINLFARAFSSTANQSHYYNTEHPEQFVKSNIPFSRLIIVGVIVLFCGLGLIVQNQINKNNNSNDGDQIIVTKNNSATESNVDNKVAGTLDNNDNKLSESSKNNDVATASTQKKDPPDATLAPKNKPNTTKPDPQTKTPATKPVVHADVKPDQTVTKNSVWDRPVTDNYSPWMKGGQILLDKPESQNDPNANIHATENQNNIITQTSASQISSSKITTPYPSGANPNLQSQSPSVASTNRGNYYGTNNYSNMNSYSKPNTERAAPPPYVNSKSIPMSQPFHSHAPVVTGQTQGRIAVAETPATYRNVYDNRNDLRTASTIPHSPAYTYPNQPTGTIAHNPQQPPLTASAYSATTHYPNATLHQPQPTTNYTNPNQTYQNNYYQNTSYPNITYPNGTYSGGAYPNHTLPR